MHDLPIANQVKTISEIVQLFEASEISRLTVPNCASRKIPMRFSNIFNHLYMQAMERNKTLNELIDGIIVCGPSVYMEPNNDPYVDFCIIMQPDNAYGESQFEPQYHLGTEVLQHPGARFIYMTPQHALARSRLDNPKHEETATALNDGVILAFNNYDGFQSTTGIIKNPHSRKLRWDDSKVQNAIIE